MTTNDSPPPLSKKSPRHAEDVELQAVIESDGELQAADFQLELATLLRYAGPWGQHFPEPMFDGRFNVVSQRLVGEKHLKLVLSLPDSRQLLDAIAFNVDLQTWPDQSIDYVEVAYRLDVKRIPRATQSATGHRTPGSGAHPCELRGRGGDNKGLTFQWLEGLDWPHESTESPMNISEAARPQRAECKDHSLLRGDRPDRSRYPGRKRLPPVRTCAGLEALQFLARAREVGFDLEECRQLLDLHRDPSRQSRHARELVLEKSQQLQLRIDQLLAMQQVLEDMALRCRGDEGPECAILEDLATSPGDAA